MAMKRIGLVGCGTHANWAVAPAILGSGRLELAAVADVNPQNLERISAPTSAARFADHRRMLESCELDAVYVATLVDSHAQVAIDAMNAGKHVVCEKPMAGTAEECGAMVQTARDRNRVLAVNFETRYHAESRQVRQWISQGLLGRIEAVHIQEFWDGHKAFGPLSERRKRLTDLSGALDCGIHKADLTRYWVGGQWLSVQARGRWFGETVSHPPHVSILAELDNGVLVTLGASFAYGAYMQPRAYSDVLTIVGTRGVINHFEDRLGQSVLRLHSQELVAEAPVNDQGHAQVMEQLLRDFADVIDGKTPPAEMARGEDGLAAQVFVQRANGDANAHRLNAP